MEDISLHVLDIIQNSITAGASVIRLSLTADTGTLELLIDDNGQGMNEELVKNAVDPFVTHRTTRKVGLGLPLLKDSAELTGGRLEINSVPGRGTEVKAYFFIGHIDRLPLGDIAETISEVVLAHPLIDMEIMFSNGNAVFEMKTVELKDRLGEVPITELEVINWIRDYLNEGIEEIFGGVLDEVDS